MNKLVHWLAYGLGFAYDNLQDFMVWNSFLAFIPLVLSFWLFRGRGRRSPLWWLGAVTWLAFLPNAPYILTDLIHLVHDIRRVHSIWIITLILVPQYLLFMGFGVQAYVLSLLNLGHYLRRQGLAVWVLPSEVMIHGLTAMGIYLGRFPRFNSWDILTRPDALVEGVFSHLLDKRPLAIVVITFGVLLVTYSLAKALTLGLWLYWREFRSQGGRDRLHGII
ncbi:DUF1361 domain-containing protein [Prochlorothrix hollandica]|uniref:DUF1361 domain-containing protein n=1 Tax=Prochlorothrix hollandica TaxID=1223 RepID=UPI0005C6AE08|nr:DUF1361 domain-containing protein [Prochlorothrix hollandica]